jgi:hypothetical protein
MADPVQQVIELDFKSPTTTASPVKAKWEKDAERPRCSGADLQKKLESDLALHTANRERLLEEKAKKGHDDVEHARQIAATHKREVISSIQHLKEVLEEKQRWAQELRDQCKQYKSDRAYVDVEKAKIISEEQKLINQVSTAELAHSLQKAQQIAAMNRAAIEQFKRVSAEYDVLHSQEVHDQMVQNREKARHVMESALKDHQSAAETLRNFLIKYKTVKAHDEVEHAQQVHEKHEQDVEDKTRALESEIEQKEVNAMFSHWQHLDDIASRGHADVVHAQEVASEHKTGNDEVADLEHLEVVLGDFDKTIQSHFSALDLWFLEHYGEIDFE